MINLSLNLPDGDAPKFLFMGAHSDDIEIGCGGTILRLIQKYPNCRIYWTVFSTLGVRKAEAEKGAELFAGKNLEKTFLREYADGFMPWNGAEIKATFEEIKKEVAPDVVFAHTRKDAHQDHRLINELTWNTYRNHLVLEYEIPKFDGDLGQPNFFVPLEKEHYEAKVAHLMTAFGSQRSKKWFEESTFMGLMRLRGMECVSSSGYAEAFHCRKAVL